MMSDNMQTLINRFNDFKRTYTGNPQQEVMNMVQTGRISQDQLNRAQAMANQLIKILK